jgi:hypothetical protein
VVRRGSVTGVEKEIYVGVVVDVWEDEERARLLAALNGVVMLRCEACEEISSMSPASLLRWEEIIDIESLAVVESSLCASMIVGLAVGCGGVGETIV